VQQRLRAEERLNEKLDPAPPNAASMSNADRMVADTPVTREVERTIHRERHGRAFTRCALRKRPDNGECAHGRSFTHSTSTRRWRKVWRCRSPGTFHCGVSTEDVFQADEKRPVERRLRATGLRSRQQTIDRRTYETAPG
jgi:hypothetical protein